MQDYFLKKFGSEEIATDLLGAAMFGLWDTNKFEWNQKLLKLFDMDKALLSSPTPSAKRIGTISKEAAEKSGFAEGMPIVTGAGDQNSAVIGAGIINEGDMSVSIGTGEIAITCLDNPFRDPEGMNIITNHAINGKWQMEGL